MDNNQQKTEANILLLGAENVGKSGKLCEFAFTTDALSSIRV